MSQLIQIRNYGNGFTESNEFTEKLNKISQKSYLHKYRSVGSNFLAQVSK